MLKPKLKKLELFACTLSTVRTRVFAVILFLFLSVLAVSFLVPQRPAYAVTSSMINFQARVQTSAGFIVPDGFYNVQFKLYDTQANGTGTNLWTESYYDSNGVTAGNDNRARITHGYLTVSLGSQTAFPSTINWDQPLYLTMNIGGTTQTATPTYDGEMLTSGNRMLLTAVPYSFRAGQLATSNVAGTFISTLQLLQPTVGSQIFQIPDMGAAGTYTLCVQGGSSCGGSGNYVTLQATSPGVPDSGNLNISGFGIAGTALQAPLFDTATAIALNLGTTNATAIALNQNTTIATGKTLAVNGTAIFQPNANSTTAFQIQNAAGTSNLFVADTTNNRIGIGTATPNRTVELQNATNPQLRLSSSSTIYTDLQTDSTGALTVTPSGSAVNFVAPIGVGYTDNFSSTTINSAWSFAANDNDPYGDSTYSLSDNPGYMRLYANSNNAEDCAGAGYNCTRLLRPTTSGDGSYTTEINLTTLPDPAAYTLGYMHINTGLMIIEDPANFMMFGFSEYGVSGGGTHLISYGNVNGVLTGNQSDVPISFTGHTALTIQVVKSGTSYTYRYHFENWDGSTWSTYGSAATFGMSPNQVGFMIANNNSGHAPVDFNYFTSTVSPGVNFAVSGYQSLTGSLTVGGAALFRGVTSTTAFQIQNATGTSNLFIADTKNSRIGIGTANPSATVSVQGSTSDNTATALNIQNTAGSSLLTLKNDGTGSFGTDYGNNMIGSRAVNGFSYGGRGIMMASEFSTSSAFNVDHMSLYVGPIDSGSNAKYWMAIYNDDGSDNPSSVRAATIESTLVANSWNTLTISNSLAAGTKYWLVFATNTTSDSLNQSGINGACLNSKYSNYTYSSGNIAPSPYTVSGTDSYCHSIIATGTAIGSGIYSVTDQHLAKVGDANTYALIGGGNMLLQADYRTYFSLGDAQFNFAAYGTTFFNLNNYSSSLTTNLKVIGGSTVTDAALTVQSVSTHNILVLNDSSGVAVMNVTYQGATTFQNSTDSASAFKIQSASSSGSIAVFNINTSALRVEIGSRSDIKLIGSGNVRNAITKDFTCTVTEAVNDIVIIAGVATVGRTSTASNNRVAGVVVAKPSSTVCTVAIKGEVQVWFSSNATPATVGDPVETSVTAGAAQSTTTPSAGAVLGHSTSAKDGSNLVWVIL